jgi:hypothetical protein
MLQRVPFQFSTAKPAAQMSSGDMAAIDDRLSVAFGFGSGLETGLQPVPFQCSISALGQQSAKKRSPHDTKFPPRK